MLASASLVTYIRFRLVLTLPLIFAGLSLLLLAYAIIEEKWKVTKTIIANTGALLLFSGVVFSFMNIRDLTKVGQRFTFYEGDYSKKGLWLSGADQELGYRYKPYPYSYRSRKKERTSIGTQLLYDVTYSIDSNGNRLTPSHAGSKTRGNAILFLGDSYTFGEGLDDNETMPFYVQLSTNQPSVNAGMHGYGAHQALYILEHEPTFRERTRGYHIKTVVYRLLLDHVNRAAGYSPWDEYGPCYEVGVYRKVEYKGSFHNCGKRSSSSFAIIANSFALSAEPWSRYFFKKFTQNGNYYSTDYSDKDYNRFLGLILAMNNVAQSRGARYIVIAEDLSIDPLKCENAVPGASRLLRDLKSNNIETVLVSNVYSNSQCMNGSLRIAGDGHPSSYANLLLGSYFSKFLKGSSNTFRR